MIRIIEKLIEIDEEDINYIYQPLKDFIDNVKYNGFDDELLNFILDNNNDTYIINDKLSSAHLRSFECKSAYKDNPIQIEIVISNNGSFYSPFHNLLRIAHPKGMYRFIVSKYPRELLIKEFNLSTLFDYMDRDEMLFNKNKIINEFNDDFLKSRIYHELSHWIDDTKNSRHLLKLMKDLDYCKDRAEYLYNKYKHKNINLSYVEINAQVNSIYYLSKKYSKEKWNLMNIYELISRSNTLRAVYNEVRNNYKDLVTWLRLLTTRMYREGILGKNMNYIPKDDKAIHEAMGYLGQAHEDYRGLFI